MVRRASRWVSVLSVLALATVGVLAAMVPAGAGVGQPPPPNCELPPNGELDAQQEGSFCAELEVTKVVTGDPAPGTTFDVVVECVAPPNGASTTAENEGQVGTQQLPPGHVPPYEETLHFGEEGGTQSIFLLRNAVCTVSEEPPAGCELVNINPEVVEVQAGLNLVGTHVYPVTVTNDCPPEPETITEVVEVPVQVAAPVVAQARFTG